MRKVVILYKFLPQYRVDFFNQLREELTKKNIELILIYGKLKDTHSKKNDEVDLPWAIYRENKILNIGKYHLIWQPSLDYIKECDLVIVEQANKLLINYLLMLMRKISKIKFAYWGHGANLQDKSDSLMNKFKYLYLNQCDYWFAYTEGVKRFLEKKSVSTDIITVVNNAIDTQTLRNQYINYSLEEVNKAKYELEIEGDNIAIYSGALYNIKKIDFLIASAILIKKSIYDFHLIIIGSGPDNHIAIEASEKYSWIHYVGPKFGIDRIVYFKMASLFMLPGAVGLAILDSFSTDTPLVTTNIPLHGPEIEYLKTDYNGIMTEFNLSVYSKQIIYLLQNKNVLASLKVGCITSFEKYTVENMVHNFIEGVEKCLER